MSTALLSELTQRESSQPQQVTKHTAQIARTARDLVQAMDETVWAINPRNDNLPRLAGYIIQYAEKDLKGKSFIELLVLEDDLHDLPPRLEEICLEQREQLRHETTTQCKDGTVRHIVWLHSRLNRHSANDPAVLSVGLDITEHKQAEGRLAWLADHDPGHRCRKSEAMDVIPIERVNPAGMTLATYFVVCASSPAPARSPGTCTRQAAWSASRRRTDGRCRCHPRAR